MPLHQWYTPRGFYTAEEKAKLAAAITDIYYRSPVQPLAKLLVEVQFFELDKTDRFVSGDSEAADKQVQIRVYHVARQTENREQKIRFTEIYESVIKPYTQDRGVTWEVQVTEEDPFLWRICGLIPPYAVGSKEGQELWIKTNKALPY